MITVNGPATMRRMAQPVGTAEIAELLGVAPRTVHQWKQRGVLPPPDHRSVNGSPAWEWARILLWAGETGRLRTPELEAAYTAMTNRAPPAVKASGPRPTGLDPEAEG